MTPPRVTASHSYSFNVAAQNETRQSISAGSASRDSNLQTACVEKFPQLANQHEGLASEFGRRRRRRRQLYLLPFGVPVLDPLHRHAVVVLVQGGDHRLVDPSCRREARGCREMLRPVALAARDRRGDPCTCTQAGRH